MLDAGATVALLTREPARTALLLDFDGSLAPIVERAPDAVALPAAIPVLEELARHLGRVAIVSGRPVEFLAAQVPVPGVVLAGLYGMETMEGGIRRVDDRVTPFLDRVAAVADEADRRFPPSVVERKGGVSVTLHWRPTPELEPDVRAFAADASARSSLHALETRMAIELRPPIDVDKGAATERLIVGYAVAGFAGDDTGDLPAFAALERATREGRLDASVRIGVLSPEAPAELRANVDVVVDGPDGLVTLLEEVARSAARPRA